MRRTELKRGTKPLERKTGLRRVSDKTRDDEPARRACVAAVKRRDGGCVFWRHVEAAEKAGKFMAESVFPPCLGPLTAHELSHRRNCDPTNPNDCVCLCFGHNGYLEDHPAVGYALGLLVRGNGLARRGRQLS